MRLIIITTLTPCLTEYYFECEYNCYIYTAYSKSHASVEQVYLLSAQDPDAKKPEDWDDREKIDDPDDKKPEDYDKPEHIVDPDAKKPEDWDDEMDGEWEPPMIDNPDYKVCVMHCCT